MTKKELLDKFFPDGVGHYGRWFYCPHCKDVYHEGHFCIVKNQLIAPSLGIGVEKNDDNTSEFA